MELKINPLILRSAAIFAGLAVILGALGAHALKSVLAPESLASFITAVRYQMWHSLALLALALIAQNIKLSPWIFRLWVLGIILFSGSIYLLTIDELIGVNLSFLGPITPLGGLTLIAGWILLAASTSASPKNT